MKQGSGIVAVEASEDKILSTGEVVLAVLAPLGLFVLTGMVVRRLYKRYFPSTEEHRHMEAEVAHMDQLRAEGVVG